MIKVYRDKSLGYTPTATFGLPEDYNPCSKDEQDSGGNGDMDIDEVFE